NCHCIPIIIAGLAVGATTYLLYKLYEKKSKKSEPKLLENNQEKYSIPLIEKENISHDTRRYRFGLPSKEHVLGLPVGQHIYLSATLNDKFVSRSYTPVTSDDDKGYVDLVIKVYFANQNPKFPQGGLMTQHLENLKIGECINVRGPNGHLIYKGCGRFAIRSSYKAPYVERTFNKVGMIAGGTGITPMLQIIRQAFKDDNDGTRFWLLYANQTESDILLRKELENVRDSNPERMKLWYTLDRPSDGWAYSSGFVNEEMMTAHLPQANDDTIILMCGPPAMIKYACLPNLEKIGHKETQLFSY
ncbi:NADH-cytochrome b5 reductase 3, partial [Blomia tropicalis]